MVGIVVRCLCCRLHFCICSQSVAIQFFLRNFISWSNTFAITEERKTCCRVLSLCTVSRWLWVIVSFVSLLRRPVSRGGEDPLQNISPPLEKCVEHRSKLLDSLKNLGLSENSSPPLVAQAGYGSAVAFGAWSTPAALRTSASACSN